MHKVSEREKFHATLKRIQIKVLFCFYLICHIQLVFCLVMAFTHVLHYFTANYHPSCPAAVIRASNVVQTKFLLDVTP